MTFSLSVNYMKCLLILNVTKVFIGHQGLQLAVSFQEKCQSLTGTEGSGMINSLLKYLQRWSSGADQCEII